MGREECEVCVCVGGGGGGGGENLYIYINGVKTHNHAFFSSPSSFPMHFLAGSNVHPTYFPLVTQRAVARTIVGWYKVGQMNTVTVQSGKIM